MCKCFDYIKYLKLIISIIVDLLIEICNFFGGKFLFFYFFDFKFFFLIGCYDDINVLWLYYRGDN